MKKHFTILFLGIIFTLSSMAQVTQTVIVEHFTNTECSICASRNPALYALLDNHPEVIHMAWHPSSPYPGCIFSQFNVIENDARTNYFGIYGGTPRVVLNGEVVSIGSQLLTEDQLNAKLGKTSDYSIQLEQQTAGDSVAVTAIIKRVNGSSTESLVFHADLAEKLINYNAPNGETQHHEVFRKNLLNESINLANAGDSIVITKNYAVDAVWQENQMIVIALLQQASDKKIIQVSESGFISNPTGIKTNDLATGLFYPNPANSRISFTHEASTQFNKASLYNVFGKRILETGLTQAVRVDDLPTGYYFPVFEKNNKEVYTTKVIISR